jgi:hypothetical protein
MAGLVPAIHALLNLPRWKDVDARDKRGHDAEFAARAAFLIARTRARPSYRSGGFAVMASLDTISIAILLGSLLVLAGILSSLIALRFGAPLLLVFLLLGMLAGEGGPGGLKFDSVRTA